MALRGSTGATRGCGWREVHTCSRCADDHQNELNTLLDILLPPSLGRCKGHCVSRAGEEDAGRSRLKSGGREEGLCSKPDLGVFGGQPYRIERRRHFMEITGGGWIQGDGNDKVVREEKTTLQDGAMKVDK